VCVPADTSTNHPIAPIEEEDSNWVSLADDASMGEMNNIDDNPYGDAPTDFEQANFE
jgi:hypothetical protein